MRDEVGRRMEQLEEIRSRSGTVETVGLPAEVVAGFLDRDMSLGRAIDDAHQFVSALDQEEADLLKEDEDTLRHRLQESYMNFYPDDTVCPYVAVAARGPWLVSAHGAVIHDSGGYGMLGFGHAPDRLLARIARPWPMANVMTPSFSQRRFALRLQKEIGARRGGCPYSKFACLNSGSEAVALTVRIVDLYTRSQTDPGARHAGKRLQFLALTEGFHGRTDAPARLSHSTRRKYAHNLASFRRDGDVEFVPVNDVGALRAVFEGADRNGVFIEAMYMEPVMGEGAPGRAITREFYDVARGLTREHGSMLVVDSIQAALRAHGCLSIIDYPGFEDCDPPDMETYSKALNAGQFPLSVVAFREGAADQYVKGIYGNTMTSNPRALELGCAVLDMVDDRTRENIRVRGAELKARLEDLQREDPGAILSVEGTGLLVCAELDSERFPVTGDGGMEEALRLRGIQVIHGGENGIRLTPCFEVTSEEIDLLVGTLREVLRDAA